MRSRERTQPIDPSPVATIDGEKITTGARVAGEARAEGVTLTTDKNTSIIVNGKPATLADLKVGQTIVVTAPRDDKGPATKIEVSAEPAKK